MARWMQRLVAGGSGVGLFLFSEQAVVRDTERGDGIDPTWNIRVKTKVDDGSSPGEWWLRIFPVLSDLTIREA